MATRKKTTKKTARKKTTAKRAVTKTAVRKRTAPTGPRVTWWEITAKDKASSDSVKKFFTSVFGWKVESDPQHDYGQVSAAQAGIGGGISAGPGGMNAVTFYIEVDDPDKYLRKIGASGGRTVMPTTTITPTTTIAQFADPAGNVIGLLKSGGMS